jgi:hypothetical protein
MARLIAGAVTMRNSVVLHKRRVLVFKIARGAPSKEKSEGTAKT